jgi:hypothetical protein
MPMSPRLLRPRQQSGFDPRLIADLGLWLDPTNSASYTQASGQIEEWRDKSGNSRDWSQATANNRPTLFTSSSDVQTATAATINGRQALFFDGVNDRLDATATARDIVRNVPGVTIFAVVVFPSAVNARHDMFSVQRGNNALRLIVSTTTTARWQLGARRENETAFLGASANNTITAGVSYVVSARVDYIGGGVLLRANGVSRITGTLNSTGSNSEDFDPFQANIGSFGAGSFFPGNMGSVLAYRRALSDAEIQTVERGLAAAWGITL